MRREVGLEGIGSRTVQYGAESVKCGWQTVRLLAGRSLSLFVFFLAPALALSLSLSCRRFIAPSPHPPAIAVSADFESAARLFFDLNPHRHLDSRRSLTSLTLR